MLGLATLGSAFYVGGPTAGLGAVSIGGLSFLNYTAWQMRMSATPELEMELYDPLV